MLRNGSAHVFIERAGVLQEVPDLTLSEKSLMVAVKNIARRLGDDISEQKPILDSRLPDGSRVAAVIPPCSIHGVTLTIRKFNGQRRNRHGQNNPLKRLGKTHFRRRPDSPNRRHVRDSARKAKPRPF